MGQLASNDFLKFCSVRMASSDQQLIQSILAGQQQAFTELTQHYRKRLISFLTGRHQLPKDEAEDIVQDVFATLVENNFAALRSFAGRSSFYTYLCAIALRRLYRSRRRMLPRAEPAVDNPPHEPAADPTEKEITAADVRQALQTLPEEFRIALMLYHFGGMEYHEIAALLDIPVNTVATRICRAKRRLRELLAPE